MKVESSQECTFTNRLRQIAATDTPLLRIKIIGTVTYILDKAERHMLICQQNDSARGCIRKGDSSLRK